MPETLLDRLGDALRGRYSVLRELGEGGMATVFLARDEKHDREVALKVLKPELAAVVGAERFLTEIKTTARLQHPNILALYDSGEAGGFVYYVMPYVEGESLRDRLGRERQLPVAEAVRIASELLEALDYAHRAGVIHRDIKPANILLLEGRPLIADFGIALAVGAAGGPRLTETGLSVGTPYYMSPEQALGDMALGPTADVYSLGCVLYETIVGEPPFTGSSAQAVLGRIIEGGPVTATTQRPTTPLHVDAALRCALERLPADRFSTAAAFSRALADEGFRHGALAAEGGAKATSGPWKLLSVSLGLALVAALGALLQGGFEPGASSGVLRYSVDAPLEVGLEGVFGSQIAISPDGGLLAFVGRGPEEATPMVYLRERDRLEPRPIPGTQGAHQATFSPDGRGVAFLTGDRTLKVASLTGAPPETLVEAGLVRGGLSWADDGHLYFTSAGSEEALPGLRRVPATGGAVEIVTVVDTMRAEIRHFFPDVLPGSRFVVVTVAREVRYDPANREVAVLDLASGETLARFAGTMGIWSKSGHVLIVGGDGVLKAAPFDVERREAGQATSVFSGVQIEVQASVDIDLSDSGTLVYSPGASIAGSRSRLVWVDRSGQSTDIDEAWSGFFTAPRLSPDGRRVAVALDNPERQAQLWVKSLDDGRETLLSVPGTNNWSPSWLDGGNSVAYAANGSGAGELWTRRADAATAAELLLGPETVSGWESVEMSSDGAWVVFDAGSEIGVRRLDGDGPEVSVARHASADAPALSPDGRWIAYTSEESGVEQIYVRPFPDVDSGRWQVTPEAARAPRWSRDGRELFYLSGDSLMVARVTEGETFSIEAGTPLFATEPYWIPGPVPPYDVHPDGQRLLMIERPNRGDGDRIFVVEGFFEELERMEDGGGR